MKTTYLINKEQSDGSVCLSIVSASEWLSIVKENKGLSLEQKRHFILDYIADGDDIDCMVIEASLAEYRAWDCTRPAEKRNRRAGQPFQHVSLDAPINDSESSGSLMDLVAADTLVEDMACDLILMDELKKALASWKPWANELLEVYLSGQKRTCTDALVNKYGVSPQAVRKYKRQFEEFVKNFLGVFRFSS